MIGSKLTDKSSSPAKIASRSKRLRGACPGVDAFARRPEPMTRFKLTLEYDGARFVWQRQENGVSVQKRTRFFAMTGRTRPCPRRGRTNAGSRDRAGAPRDWAPFRLSDGLNAHLFPFLRNRLGRPGRLPRQRPDSSLGI